MSRSRRASVKLAVRGEIASGKSALVRALLGRPFLADYQATLGAVIHSWEAPGGGIVVWDLEGEWPTRPLPPAYLLGSALVLIVADASQADWPSRFERLAPPTESSGRVLRVLCKTDAATAESVDAARSLPADQSISSTSAREGRGIAELRARIRASLDVG